MMPVHAVRVRIKEHDRRDGSYFIEVFNLNMNRWEIVDFKTSRDQAVCVATHMKEAYNAGPLEVMEV